jgi:hypothetical protein
MSEYLHGHPEDPDDTSPLVWANVSGWNAREDGRPLDANPYESGSPMAREWERGWKAKGGEKST